MVHRESDRPNFQPNSNYLRTKRVVARYLYQIIVGCNDPNCSKVYCKTNQIKFFNGKKVKHTPAVVLAMHIAGLKGESELCNILQPLQLPLEISSQIDENEPLHSRILKPKSSLLKSSEKINIRINTWGNYHIIGGFSDLGKYHNKTYFPQEPILSIFSKSNPSEILRAYMKSRFWDSFHDNLYLSRVVINHANSAIMRYDNMHNVRRGQLNDWNLLLLHSLEHLNLNDWKYLNLQIENPIFHDNASFSKYRYALNRQTINSWLPGSKYAPISFETRISNFQTDDSNMSFQCHFPESKLAPTVEEYFHNRLCQPLYSFNTDFNHITLLQPAHRVMLPYNTRVAMLKFLCFRRMSLAIQRVKLAAVSCSNLDGLRDNSIDADWVMPREGPLYIPIPLHIYIERGNLFSDFKSIINQNAMYEVTYLPMKVELGGGEIGVDEGGVLAEFFHELGKEIMSKDEGFFEYDGSSFKAWFNPFSTKSEAEYTYIGYAMGLAVHNGCTIGVELPILFYRLLKNYAVSNRDDIKMFSDFSKQHISSWEFFSISDLKDVFPVYYTSFKNLKKTPENIISASLSFSLTLTEPSGKEIMIDFGDSGKDNQVTAENFDIYVKKFTHALYLGLYSSKIARIFSVLLDIFPSSLIDLFSAKELKVLFEGEHDIAVSDLKKVIRYQGFNYNSADESKTSDTIRYFWKIVDKMQLSRRSQLLKFITGTDSIPQGIWDDFKITIQANGVNTDSLPTASVCTSTLLLPRYTSMDKLETSLGIALDNSSGFGLR